MNAASFVAIGCAAVLASPAVLVRRSATPRASAATPEIARASGVFTIAGRPHPYLIEGAGLTCIVTGLAPSYPPLFSPTLKQHVRFVYGDFKNSWNAESPQAVETTTMESLVAEIDEIRAALGLQKVCVVGHSAPGYVALEYALRHPERTSHAILIAVEPYFNRAFMKARADFWEADASADRKATLARNVGRVPDDLLRRLSPRDAFAMRYVRNAPRYFYDPSYDFYWAWAGQHISAELLPHYFNKILAEYDPRPRLVDNTVPMFLALGRYDYDVPYHEWDRSRKSPHLTSQLFERSGHFPMIEEGALFDERVIQWLRAPQ